LGSSTPALRRRILSLRRRLEHSAALVCDVTRDRAIPRDWQHIVGHGQLQPADRTDPGPHWPWIAYIHRVQALCGELVVDDSTQFQRFGARSDPSAGRLASRGQPRPDYYGGGYHWASTNPSATDGVEFSFYVATAGRPHARRTLDERHQPRAAGGVRGDHERG